MKKAVDFCNDGVKITIGMAAMLFWGVTTPNLTGKHQPLSGVFLDFVVGEMVTYTTSSFELKVIIAVLGGFVNSPTICGRNTKKILLFPQMVKTVGLWQCYIASDLFVLT